MSEFAKHNDHLQIPPRARVGLVFGSLTLSLMALLAACADKPQSQNPQTDQANRITQDIGEASTAISSSDQTVDIAATAAESQTSGLPSAKIGEIASDFELETIWGENLSLEKIRDGRPMLLNVVGTFDESYKDSLCKERELNIILNEDLAQAVVAYFPEIKDHVDDFPVMFIDPEKPGGFKETYPGFGRFFIDKNGQILFTRGLIAPYTMESLAKSLIDAGNRVTEGDNLLPYDIDSTYQNPDSINDLNTLFESATIGIMDDQNRLLIKGLLGSFGDFTREPSANIVTVDMLNAAGRRIMELYGEGGNPIYLEFLKKYAAYAYYYVKSAIDSGLLPDNAWDYMSTNFVPDIPREWGTASIYLGQRVCNYAIVGPQ